MSLLCWAVFQLRTGTVKFIRQEWDFVHDQLVTGSKLRILTIVDTFSRFSPATDPRFQYKGEDVLRTLERVCSEVGYPKSIGVENGSEFISRDLGAHVPQDRICTTAPLELPDGDLACGSISQITSEVESAQRARNMTSFSTE
jgi:transposase InsO family protein